MIIVKEMEYEINTNVNMGIFRRFREDPENMTCQYDFISDVLIPHPTHEEIDELFGTDDIEEIMLAFEDAKEKRNVELKKKRSR